MTFVGFQLHAYGSHEQHKPTKFRLPQMAHLKKETMIKMSKHEFKYQHITYLTRFHKKSIPAKLGQIQESASNSRLTPITVLFMFIFCSIYREDVCNIQVFALWKLTLTKSTASFFIELVLCKSSLECLV